MEAHLPQPLDILLPIVPYAIILINYVLFKLLRSLVNRLFAYYLIDQATIGGKNKKRARPGADLDRELKGKSRLLKLFIDELVSTCELCADCAELNVVYERHGSTAYGLSLFLLTYLWTESFGQAHTSPGYLAEDYFLFEGNKLLRTGDAYARFIGQSLAMPMAWRLASLYWKYQLLNEHSALLIVEDCKSSLTTSTLNGFMIEFTCCLICRLAELIGHKLLERRSLSQRAVSMSCSFLCSVLVVLALELSGGYFNPVLAGSLEYGCKGIHLHQHALVFWLGPLLGHVLARGLFRRYGERLILFEGTKAGASILEGSSLSSSSSSPSNSLEQRRQTRSGSQRKRR